MKSYQTSITNKLQSYPCTSRRSKTSTVNTKLINIDIALRGMC